MEKVSTLSERLRLTIAERGLSASDFGRLCGIDRSLISHYVHGRKYPKLENVRRMAAVLYVTPEWLEGYNVDKTPAPVQLSPLENDLVLGFRSLNGDEKLYLIEYIKNRQG